MERLQRLINTEKKKRSSSYRKEAIIIAKPIKYYGGKIKNLNMDITPFINNQTVKIQYGETAVHSFFPPFVPKAHRYPYEPNHLDLDFKFDLPLKKQ